jgi:hypothetical protein
MIFAELRLDKEIGGPGSFPARRLKALLNYEGDSCKALNN